MTATPLRTALVLIMLVPWILSEVDVCINQPARCIFGLIRYPGTNANYMIASTASPYVVFGAVYSTGCPAQMISVDSTGTLTAVVANATFDSGAGVHGLAISSDNKFLYSADDMGNAIVCTFLST